MWKLLRDMESWKKGLGDTKLLEKWDWATLQRTQKTWEKRLGPPRGTKFLEKGIGGHKKPGKGDLESLKGHKI